MSRTIASNFFPQTQMAFYYTSNGFCCFRFPFICRFTFITFGFVLAASVVRKTMRVFAPIVSDSLKLFTALGANLALAIFLA
jgi:hypothetical protein